MDKIRYSSFKFKVWEDKFYKIEKHMQAVHIDDIKLVNASSRHLNDEVSGDNFAENLS